MRTTFGSPPFRQAAARAAAARTAKRVGRRMASPRAWPRPAGVPARRRPRARAFSGGGARGGRGLLGVVEERVGDRRREQREQERERLAADDARSRWRGWYPRRRRSRTRAASCRRRTRASSSGWAGAGPGSPRGWPRAAVHAPSHGAGSCDRSGGSSSSSRRRRARGCRAIEKMLSDCLEDDDARSARRAPSAAARAGS